MNTSNINTSINERWGGYPKIQSDTPASSNFPMPPSPSAPPSEFKEHKVTEIEITLEEINSVFSEAEKSVKTGMILGVSGGSVVGVALLAAGLALMVFSVASNPLLFSIGTVVLLFSGGIGLIAGSEVSSLYLKVKDCPDSLPTDAEEFRTFVNSKEDNQRLFSEGRLRLLAEAFSEKMKLDFEIRHTDQLLERHKQKNEEEIARLKEQRNLLIHEQECRLTEVTNLIAQEAKVSKQQL